MKSRLRSRWYRPNEKPLESPSENKKSTEPFGEIQSTDSKLVDDLSKVQAPPKRETRNYSNNNDNSNNRGNKSRPKHRKKPRERNDKISNDSENRNNGKKENSSGQRPKSDDQNYKPRRRRKKSYPDDRKKSKSPDNRNTQVEKNSPKKSGISGFLSKIFGG
jgi:hypothetical protein